MQFGQVFWLQTPEFSIPASQRIKDTVAFAVASEQAGFDTLWFAEQHFTNYGYSPNPVLLATAVAQHTSRVRIGMSIVALPLWHPIRLAEDLAMLDVLSDGRLDVGVGKGYQHIGFRGLGIDIDERAQRFDESLDVLLRAWTTDNLSLDGPTWHNQQAVNVLPKPVQDPHPPIWIAVTSDENIRTAAKTDFHIFGSANWVNKSQGMSDHELYLEERRKAGKTDDRWSYALNRQVRVLAPGEDREAAWESFAARSRHTFRLARRLRADTVRYDRGYLHPDPIDEDQTDEDIRERTLFGTPDEIVGEILRLHDELEASMIIAQVDFGGPSSEEILQTIRLFGAEVIPAVHAAIGDGAE